MKDRLSNWIKHIHDTQEEEISCSACLDQISQYVDLELAGGDIALAMPRVRHHLDQCQVCSEEYHVLRELARLEAEGNLPDNDDLSNRLKG